MVTLINLRSSHYYRLNAFFWEMSRDIPDLFSPFRAGRFFESMPVNKGWTRVILKPEKSAKKKNKKTGKSAYRGGIKMLNQISVTPGPDDKGASVNIDLPELYDLHAASFYGQLMKSCGEKKKLLNK